MENYQSSFNWGFFFMIWGPLYDIFDFMPAKNLKLNFDSEIKNMHFIAENMQACVFKVYVLTTFY